MTQPLTTACWRASAAAALATSLFAAPAAFAQAPSPKAPATITVQHAKGSTVVPLAPKRVVVYDLASLDTMQALNLPVTALAKANFPSYMQAYADARYLPAGTLFEPDFDALSHIQPDLIVVAGRSAGKYEILSKIAPTVDLSVNNQQLLADMQRNVVALASLWGKEAQGEQLMQRVRAEVDSTRALAQQQAPGLLVLAISTTLNAQPPGARFGLLHDVLGVKPALPADASKPRGVPMKMEEIRQLNPAWLYVIDRNAGTGSTTGRDGKPVVASTELFNNEAIRNSAASQQGRLVFLDPQVWYLLGVAGPQAMLQTTAQLKQVWGQR